VIKKEKNVTQGEGSEKAEIVLRIIWMTPRLVDLIGNDSRQFQIMASPIFWSQHDISGLLQNVHDVQQIGGSAEGEVIMVFILKNLNVQLFDSDLV
jgi:hypothetical protein